MLAKLFIDKANGLDKLVEEACEVTQGTHRGGDHYWAEELPLGSDLKEVLKVAERKILQFDPSALKAITGKLVQDSSGRPGRSWVKQLRHKLSQT